MNRTETIQNLLNIFTKMHAEDTHIIFEAALSRIRDLDLITLVGEFEPMADQVEPSREAVQS